MRGSCPTHLILCMRGDKTTLRSNTQIKIPNLGVYTLNESLSLGMRNLPRSKGRSHCGEYLDAI
jgi:hypothetical protein